MPFMSFMVKFLHSLLGAHRSLLFLSSNPERGTGNAEPPTGNPAPLLPHVQLQFIQPVHEVAGQEIGVLLAGNHVRSDKYQEFSVADLG